MSKVRVITPPETFLMKEPRRLRVFLAGGITGCPDWQSQVIERISQGKYSKKIEIFNPRREVFPEGCAKEQIAWEFEALHSADLFSIWFCKEAVQPICLYELGRHLAIRHPSECVIGCDPNYPRKLDVYEQAGLAGFPVDKISTNLYDHSNRIVEWLGDESEEVNNVL